MQLNSSVVQERLLLSDSSARVSAMRERNRGSDDWTLNKPIVVWTSETVFFENCG